MLRNCSMWSFELSTHEKSLHCPKTITSQFRFLSKTLSDVVHGRVEQMKDWCCTLMSSTHTVSLGSTPLMALCSEGRLVTHTSEWISGRECNQWLPGSCCRRLLPSDRSYREREAERDSWLTPTFHPHFTGLVYLDRVVLIVPFLFVKWK